MSNKPYHHGDLRTAIIEKGIEIINEEGIATLSMRKLALACGVSHAAPYGHFANKEGLLSAIESHITKQFAAALKDSVKDAGETPEGLLRLCCAYVMFFAQNPQYFHFVFTRSSIEYGDGSEYEPYDFYKDFMMQMFDNINYPKELRLKTFIAHWAMAHGLAYIVISHGSEEADAWEEKITDILSKNYIIFKGI